MKKSILKRVSELYNDGGNIIQFLRQGSVNSIEDIMISYDFQAGSYSALYYDDPRPTRDLCDCLYNYISELEYSSILEAGVGEANKLVTLLEHSMEKLEWAGGCDLSWSRVRFAKRFAESKKHELSVFPELFVGDMSSLPLLNHSVDLVYTMYSLEPNGGREEQLLKELARIARKYVIMLEPSYELANQEQRERMDSHGYVKGLPTVAEKIGLEIILSEKFPVDENPDNPTAITICKVKESWNENEPKYPLACPITKTPLRIQGDCYYSSESMLAYPVLNGVPCLTEDNAIVATKMMDFV